MTRAIALARTNVVPAIERGASRIVVVCCGAALALAGPALPFLG
ncbi:hypothetical protein [Qipengyuania atrilutea]|nr:hypothetical protein [Actirhodobacter atriluteus]